MLVKQICPPALIYLVYGVTQITIDTILGLWNTALIKFFITLIFTLLLNYLCNIGLGIVSWLLLMIPFVLMTVIITLLLLVLGLNPKKGKISKKPDDNTILRYWISNKS